MNTKEILSDSPMNLIDLELLDDKTILPQMRYLLNNDQMIDLTLELILAGIRQVNHGSGEKDKMRQNLR